MDRQNFGERHVLLLAEGKQALSWSADRTIRLWDVEASTQLGAFYAEGQVRCSVKLCGNRLFACDRTGRVYFLEIGDHQVFTEGKTQ